MKDVYVPHLAEIQKIAEGLANIGGGAKSTSAVQSGGGATPAPAPAGSGSTAPAPAANPAPAASSAAPTTPRELPPAEQALEGKFNDLLAALGKGDMAAVGASKQAILDGMKDLTPERQTELQAKFQPILDMLKGLGQ